VKNAITVMTLFVLVATSFGADTRWRGTFIGNGSGLTNLSASAGIVGTLTNNTTGRAGLASNILTGAVLNPADGSALTNLNVTFTSTNTLTSLTVQGSVGANGVVAAIRRSANQTNDVFQVQTESNVALFGVESNGVARTSMFRATSTNAVIMKCPNGGTFLLSVGNDGTLVVNTNSNKL
jgi:hypothetical protein